MSDKKSNVISFKPKKNRDNECYGVITISVYNNGATEISSEGMSPRELRTALGYAIYLSYDWEKCQENNSA